MLLGICLDKNFFCPKAFLMQSLHFNLVTGCLQLWKTWKSQGIY